MNHKTKALLKLLLIAVVTAALAYIGVAGIGPEKKFSAANIKQGLDLAGGVSITYQTVKEEPTLEEMSDTRYKLQLRVDNYSTEAAVYQEGSNRINVDIPGVSDAETILRELGQAGAIYFIYGAGNLDYDYEKGEYILARTLEEIQADQIQFLAADRGVKHITLHVSPYVASFLCDGVWSLRRRWMWRYKVRLKIVADQSLGMVDVRYLDKSGAPLIEP